MNYLAYCWSRIFWFRNERGKGLAKLNMFNWKILINYFSWQHLNFNFNQKTLKRNLRHCTNLQKKIQNWLAEVWIFNTFAWTDLDFFGFRILIFYMKRNFWMNLKYSNLFICVYNFIHSQKVPSTFNANTNKHIDISSMFSSFSSNAQLCQILLYQILLYYLKCFGKRRKLNYFELLVRNFRKRRKIWLIFRFSWYF